ncbi:LysR family transcriptional regulator [Halomonas sp. G15]|uniref:LysR family transcriptional regulator n=1 Tax=Halomonas sp. G15 TaxID=2903521 RepID=UPI001E3B25E5|nr:LysR family transcriptional regulator [Halomonas sp. G15]MCE0732432.1 LysR family transcriptional regulator [Halomonas sp. G15]
MELRQLLYFTAVAEERSFSRAAEKLNISQPPLSRQVQQLEDELGVRLLDRGRPLTLTPAGKFFFEHVADMLQRFEDVRSRTRLLGREKQARISVGFVASTLYDQLPELLRRLRLAEPDVELELHEMTTPEQVAALCSGRIDVAFGRLHFDDDTISMEVIHKDRLLLALPRQHFLTSRDEISLRDIAAQPLILGQRLPRPSYTDLVMRYFHDQGLRPVIAFEVRDLQTALGLVGANAGVSLIPAAARRIARDDVVFREISESGLEVPVLMGYRKGETNPMLVRIKALIRDFDGWIEPEFDRKIK